MAKDTVNVGVNISPTVSVSPDSLICSGGSAHITAQPSVTVTYSWSPTTGLDNAFTATPTASPTQTTKYQLVVTDSNTCTGTASVVITVIPKPQFSITPPDKNICRGDSVHVVASGGDIYQWFPATNIYSDTSAATTVFPTATTLYAVIITNNTCHISDSLQTVINVSQPFALSVSKTNDVDCFTGQATITATGGNQYTWSPTATLANPYASSTVATPVTTTTYYVTAQNGTACIETDSIQVKIITDNMQNGYYLASAFTPNGDGVNDCFGVKKWGGIKSIQFSVYNRWGQRIFYSASPSGCWDGSFNGVAQPPDTYVYQVWANTVCGNVYRKGTVVLVR
jgi:gliding motility-associated-like protein